MAKITKSQIERFKSRFAKIKEETKKNTRLLTTGAATIGTAAALAYADGRFGDKDINFSKDGTDQDDETLKVAGLPISALIGVAGVGVGLTGLAAEYSEIAVAAGVGALSQYAAKEMHKMGKKQKGETNTAGLYGSGYSALPNSGTPYSPYTGRSMAYQY